MNFLKGMFDVASIALSVFKTTKTFFVALLYITLLAFISITGRLASAQSNHIVDRQKKDSGTFAPFESFRIVSATPSELKERRRIMKKRSPVDVPPHIVVEETA